MKWAQAGNPWRLLLRPSSALCAVLLGLLCPVAACATSCLGPITVCSSFESSAVVFRGRVLDVVWDTQPAVEHTYPDGSTVQMVAGPVGAHVRFAVEEIFRGEAGSEIVIAAGGWGTSFEKGKEYLIFAFANSANKELATSVCSRTHPLNPAIDDPDLAWLRAYPSSDGTASLFGKFFMRGAGQMPVPEDAMPSPLSVRIMGDGVNKTVAPVHDTFRVDGLTAGMYTVTAVVPAGVTTDAMREVKLTAKGCAEVDWLLKNDSHLTGRVMDESGLAVAHVGVALARREGNRLGYASVSRVETDAEGRYDFGGVAPGDYLVVLHDLGPSNLDPHRKVFYPGVREVADAKEIPIGPATKVTGIDMVAPMALRSARVTVTVLHEDGTPVDQARLAAIDPANPVQFIGGTADASGRADLSLYDGEEYTVTATTPGVREPSCGGPLTFVARDGMTLAPITLDKSVRECRAGKKVSTSATTR